MGKWSLFQAQWAQIVILRQEGYNERAISECLAVSKTAVYQAVVKFKNCGSYSDCKRSGRPRKTTWRDDILIKRCVVKSPTCSAKKIRAEIGETGSRINRRTISRCLTNELGLNSWKPDRKLRLTPAMKLQCLQFAKKYKDWTRQQWSRVLFSDETTIPQFAWRKKTVRRPLGTRYNERFTQKSMKHPPSMMIWGAISTQGTSGLFFLDPGTTMNGKKYLELIKEKLESHMAVHNCEIFMHDGAPCCRAKIVTNFLKTKNIKLLEWLRNSLDLNPI